MIPDVDLDLCLYRVHGENTALATVPRVQNPAIIARRCSCVCFSVESIRRPSPLWGPVFAPPFRGGLIVSMIRCSFRPGMSNLPHFLARPFKDFTFSLFKNSTYISRRFSNSISINAYFISVIFYTRFILLIKRSFEFVIQCLYYHKFQHFSICSWPVVKKGCSFLI